jgi:hypothetical protein
MTITIPDEVATRVLNKFAAYYNYTGAQGETKQQFAKRKIIEFVKDAVKKQEIFEAEDAARAAAAADVDTDIQLS